jgi:phosphate transport system protein
VISVQKIILPVDSDKGEDMRSHLDREFEKLKKQILSLSADVEESVMKAVNSVVNRDPILGEEVIAADEEIDFSEVDVEEEVLKILALHQPVAGDLRFVLAILKINNDLERVGDEAVNIAERSIFLANHPLPIPPFDFNVMANKAQNMLRMSLDSLMNVDALTAKKVCKLDDEVDELNRMMYSHVQTAIRQNPEYVENLIHLLSISRHLERIADYATNIAEDVIYMIEGTIIRHKTEIYLSIEN